MDAILLLGVVLLAGILIVSAVYFAFFRLAAARYWAIRKRAKLEHENARGTAHLRMLREARRSAWKVSRDCTRDLHDARRTLGQLEQEREKQLRQALERHIAYTYLAQVSGIGPMLRDRIFFSVFRGHLRDLRRAHVVRGVGEERQWAINVWVREYEARIPTLLNGPFPGKDQTTRRFSGEKKALETKVEGLTARVANLEAQIARMSEAMEPLQGVGVKDFVRVLRDPTCTSEQIDRYLQGVFAEWEPVPDWFKEVAAQESD